MKKLLYLLSAAMLLFLLTGCSGEETVPVAYFNEAVYARDGLQRNLSNLQTEQVSLQRNYDALTASHGYLTDVKAELQNDFDNLDSAYTALQLEASGFLELNSEERQAALDFIRRNGNIAELDNRILALYAEIESLNNQISVLQADVIRIAGESRAFPAGFFVAGEDFPVGRYRIYGGSSNFFVRDRNGRSRVNIIFGTRDTHVTEYIYRFAAGDEIEARSAFRMISVE